MGNDLDEIWNRRLLPVNCGLREAIGQVFDIMPDSSKEGVKELERFRTLKEFGGALL